MTGAPSPKPGGTSKLDDLEPASVRRASDAEIGGGERAGKAGGGLWCARVS
jgi:hypothetical protein